MNFIKKRFLILLTIFFSLTGIFAEENEEFEKICNRLANTKVVRGDFEQIQKVKKTGKEVKSSGIYTISADDGIIWFTKMPVESVMAVTKTYIIQEMNGRQRKIDGSKNATFTSVADVVSGLFTGKIDDIQEKFKVKCIACEEPNLFKIELTSKDKTIGSYIKNILLKAKYVGKENCHLTEIVMTSFTEDSTCYMLKNQVLTDTLNDDEKKYFN